MYNKYMCIFFFTFSFFSIPFLITFYRLKCVGNCNFSTLSTLMTQKAKPRKRLHNYLFEIGDETVVGNHDFPPLIPIPCSLCFYLLKLLRTSNR